MYAFRVSYAYSNQKKLDAESKKLEKHAANLLQSTEQWVSQIDSFNQALKVYWRARLCHGLSPNV